MSTKNILKTLALALLLVSACSKNEIAYEENTDVKGYTLPVTVNVTREGDDATKATFNDDTKKLSFSAGDKLFVKGNDYSAGGAGFFAGTLTWQSGGTFSGTILTENTYSGTIDALFTAGSALATLLPANYGNYPYLLFENEGTYSASINFDATKTFATSKATAVAQFSFEVGGYTSGTGFALSPANAILNFTITGLAASTEVAVALSDVSLSISGNVTTNGSGTATFAMSLVYNSDLNDFTLTVGGNPITLVSSSTVLERGHIYNITRSASAPLPGIFSISATQTVQFSQGNLQYQASTGTWRFAEHQYDYVGKASMGNVYVGSTKSNNESISETYTGWIDLFGWGTSGKTFASGYGTAYQPWATSTTDTDYGPTGSSSGLTGTYANGDWGVNMGSGWRTLTSAEWTYLFDTRTASTVAGTANARFAKAYLFGTTHGIILFPDSYTHPDGVTAPTDINVTGDTSWNANQYNATDWGKMEAAGAIFLPAAGYRYRDADVLLVSNVGSTGYYWSSTPYNYDATKAHYLRFSSSTVGPTNYNLRSCGYSVRLVQDVVTP